MTERGQFPIEDREHAWLSRVKQEIAESIVAMGDRQLAIVRRKAGCKPSGKAVQFRYVLGRRFKPLFRPARDLPREIVAGAAEITETDRVRIDPVQLSERRRHGEIDRATFGRLNAGQRRVVEDSA